MKDVQKDNFFSFEKKVVISAAKVIVQHFWVVSTHEEEIRDSTEKTFLSS